MARGRRGKRELNDAEAERDVLHLALRAVLDHDLDRADEVLSELLREDSDRIDAYLALAQIYRRRGEIGRAIRIHQNLLLRKDLEDEHRDLALEGLAQDFQRGGFLQRAIAGYRELLKRRPKDAKALRTSMHLEAEARDFSTAFDLQRRLARLEPENAKGDEAQLLVAMAQAAHQVGRTDEARKALNRAVKRDPAHVMAWVALGEIEAERGKNKAALAAWTHIAKEDRRAAVQIYPKLEAAFAAVGKARAYEEFLRTLIQQRPGDTAARLALARHLVARGEISMAKAELELAIERDPDHLPLYGVRARICLQEGNEAEAAKSLDEILRVLERQGLLEHRERLD